MTKQQMVLINKSMISKNITSALLVACLSIPFTATAEDKLYAEDVNYLENLYNHARNPVALSYNTIKTYTKATVDATLQRGSFNSVDQSGKINNFNALLEGVQSFGNLDISGSFRYSNIKEYNRKWNSTLYLSPNNPFVLADSIASDVTEEQFSLEAGAAYRFSPRFTAGLKLDYLTGSSADQSDPRPKINAMRLNIHPGINVHLNSAHAVGVSAVVGLYHSDINNTIINNNVDYTYFLMKGMGDNFIRTTSDAPGYNRDYKGQKYGGSVQWALTPQTEAFANLLEISYLHNRETATDGGSSYTFKGGDYSTGSLFLYDRLRFQRNNLVHNIELKATYSTERGDWYDQKKETDTEHGNISYYRILNKSKIQKGTFADATISYQLDILKEKMLNTLVKLEGGFTKSDRIHYEASTFKQNYTLMHLSLSADKLWYMKNFRLKGHAGGYYTTNLGDKQFGSVKTDLTKSYTAPLFEYESAERAGFDLGLTASTRIHSGGTSLWLSLYARTSCNFYTGKSDYSSLYNNTSLTTTHAGIQITF